LRFNTCILLFTLALTLPASLPAYEFAFITTTDYSTGSSSVIYLDGSYTTERNVESICSDAVARFYDGLVYVVNRWGCDNIQVLDPSDGFSTKLQFSVGAGSDPHDIVFVSGTKAYVSRGNETELLIVNPSTGSHLGTVDLSAFSDADGTPEMDCMILIGDLLFVSIQRLDRNDYWFPVSPSYLAVIDTRADTLYDCDTDTPGVQAVELTGTDPFGELHFDPYAGLVYFTSVGRWGMIDGGVERVDPSALESLGFLLTESASGGDINDVVIFSPSIGYAVVTDASFNNLLVRFDPSTGALTDTLYEPGDYVLADIEISPGGELFLCDRTATDPGIRIYDASTGGAIVGGTIDVGLPPFDIVFSTPIQTGADTPTSAAFRGSYPNPFNPATTIIFSLSTSGRAELSIYDAAGRRVRELVREELPAGGHEIVWNGRDDRGLPAVSGIYFARLRHGGNSAALKLVLIR
jgi:DNA-binding beta-propeller fold protein YncE